MHSDYHCIRKSIMLSQYSASEPPVYMSENLASMTKTFRTIGGFAQGFSGLKGLFVPLQTVEWARGWILWKKCQLFSYLRCIYSLKMWQMYCRTGIKMSRSNCFGPLATKLLFLSLWFASPCRLLCVFCHEVEGLGQLWFNIAFVL